MSRIGNAFQSLVKIFTPVRTRVPVVSRRWETVSPGNVSEMLQIPENLDVPEYFPDLLPIADRFGEPVIKSSDLIERMRKTCCLAATILDKCPEVLKPGSTTDELDKFIHSEIINAGAFPSPLRFLEYPKSICTSVNNIVCNGVPDDRALLSGDIVSVVVTVYANGVHGDCCKTFPVGEIDEQAQYLIDATKTCCDEAIKLCGPDVELGAIGALIENIATEYQLGLITEFPGHGIGEHYFEPPQIHHQRNTDKGVMKPGMTFTIEPILVTGNPTTYEMIDDWSISTVDDIRGAQSSHTILITKDGCEVLTLPASRH